MLLWQESKCAQITWQRICFGAWFLVLWGTKSLGINQGTSLSISPKQHIEMHPLLTQLQEAMTTSVPAWTWTEPVRRWTQRGCWAPTLPLRRWPLCRTCSGKLRRGAVIRQNARWVHWWTKSSSAKTRRHTYLASQTVRDELVARSALCVMISYH